MAFSIRVPAGLWIAPAAALCFGLALGTPAQAADQINYSDLFRAKAIKCIHPTLDAAKASIEVVKGPDTAGDTTTVRFKVYYEGWLKKNSMDADLMVRQSGSIRQVKVKVLADSGLTRSNCALETNWADF